MFIDIRFFYGGLQYKEQRSAEILRLTFKVPEI